MKLRPVARTETVKGLLQERLDKYSEALGATNSKLEALNKPGSIIKLNNMEEERALRYEAESLELDIQTVKDQMRVLDSHQAPAIAVEFVL